MIYNKNVYILGAGFSRHAQAPLIADFVTQIKRLWENPDSQLNTEERERFARLLDYRARLTSVRSKINIDLGNIEELLGLAEMDVAWGGVESILKNDYIYTMLRTLEICTRDYFLEKDTWLDPAGFTARTPLTKQISGSAADRKTSIYHLFACMVKQASIHANYHLDTIITFNYDLLLDKALAEASLAIDYAAHPMHIASGKLIEVDPVFKSKKHKPENAVCYLKLHGSANWAICAKCASFHILPPHTEELLQIPNVDAMHKDSHIKNVLTMKCPKCHSLRALYPLIVPPTWNKFQYQQLIGGVWEKALEEIREAHRIIVIGYSLPPTDTFFRYLLTLGCCTPFEPEIIIINPDEETAKPKYEKFIDQYYRAYNFKFHKIYFDNYIFRKDREEKNLILPDIVYRQLPRS